MAMGQRELARCKTAFPDARLLTSDLDNALQIATLAAMRLLAPAKINLHLRVGRTGTDGFHPILSWMCTVGLCDTLIIEPSATLGGKATLTCDDPTLPCDGTNLVVRAAEALKRSLPPSCLSSARDIAIRLAKHIPAGAGLGGGSSDAARTIIGLAQLWKAGLSSAELADIALPCGSDLPFFFHGPSSICTGRGQHVRPIPAPQARWAILILPAMPMPTPPVYRRFDELGLGDDSTLAQQPPWEQWALLPAARLLPNLANDLEAPAFAIKPELGRLRSELEQTLARPVRMSGSGSSLFTLYDEQIQADQAAILISQEFSSSLLRAPAVQLAPPIQDD